MPIQEYINQVQIKLQSGIAREHVYRPALEGLIAKTIPDITAFNDPARIQISPNSSGTLDFIIRRGEIDVGYIEAKDLNINLDKVEKSEQLKRYLDLDNLILTDYLEFRFYRDGEKIDSVRIGDALMGKVQPRPENFDKFKALLEDFGAFKGQTIRSSQKLAEMMARKARLMREIFYKAITEIDDSSLLNQYKAFKDILMHDLGEEQFADIYAQTITYGLFTARLHDPTLDDFSRAEAQGLIPKSNPFLRQLFHYVTGPDLDKRIVKYIDMLCDVFQATNVRKIFEDYGKSTRQTDPVLHFYETFLGKYDKSIKDMRGVWFTPEPVVQFIIRAIDDVLKTHFGIKDGIADNSKIDIDVETDVVQRGKRVTEKQEVHKVQLLDVATGTGTFLAEVVKQIYTRFEGMEGIWSSYIENNLLPRLHGFELLMASYAMCHMKLDLLLSEMGYKPSNPDKPPRVSVYLTNSLEEHHPDSEMLFAQFVSREANEASRIKRDMPIMVAFGNPPYSGISSNMNSWIAKNKIEDYKYVDGVHFGERKHWLNDDYVQFIRLGEHYIEKNGEGVLAYITNHSYLDNPTFRGMRWHLLNTFDDIYVLDLHGNSLKKETAPDGSADVNVFDIRQGTAIIIAVKKKQKGRKKLATIHHADLYGKRADKYSFLNKNNLKSVAWKKLDYREPFYFFAPKNNNSHEEYYEGFGLNDLFVENTVGCVTGKDKITISFSRDELIEKLDFFINSDDVQIRSRFSLKEKDARDWTVPTAKKDAKENYKPEKFTFINYRPFDIRYTLYTGNSRGFYASPQKKIMRHMLYGDNLSLITARSNKSDRTDHFFCSKLISEAKTGESTTQSCFMPLYRYEAVMGDVEQKVPNFDPAIYAKIKDAVPDVTPESLFDYIYAVLHAPAYRQRYAEFLKSDFPRIPYPDDPETFHALAAKGAAIRELHLLESPLLDDTSVTYPVSGNNIVDKPRFDPVMSSPPTSGDPEKKDWMPDQVGHDTKKGKVYINKDQYFGGVSEIAWNFYIGGYQPAQKWLKDRKGRTLSMDDIQHYRKIIKALHETNRLMKEIDQINFLPKGKN